ncbi:hypothetical protein D3C87_1341780 [compost metagenome]
MKQEKHTAHVDRENALVRIPGFVKERAHVEYSSIVEQDIESTKLLDCSVHDRLNILAS